MELPSSSTVVDVERQEVDEKHLVNSTVRNIAWRGVTIAVKGRKGASRKNVVDNVEGIVEAGELCALMGPSGAGKTSLLNYLARRKITTSKVQGEVLVNGQAVSDDELYELSSFVQQEDALISTLTCFETVDFNARLSSKRRTKAERIHFVNKLLQSFGLDSVAESFVGPFFRGSMSGGQKRRLSVASQVAGEPKILFLDEPTSGLDSTGSQQVVQYLRDLAKASNLIIICSIHQPSAAVFHKFDKLLLVSEAKTCYFGPPSDAVEYFQEAMGNHMPPDANPAEFIIDIVSTAFSADESTSASSLDAMHQAWSESERAKELHSAVSATGIADGGHMSVKNLSPSRPNFVNRIAILLHRSFIKTYRDFTVYILRFALYLVLAIILGTAQPRLGRTQDSVQELLSLAVCSTAFASFIAVSYVPTLIEDLEHHVQEKRNGFCTSMQFSISNFLLSLPYHFLTSVSYSLVLHALIGLNSSAPGMCTWILWLFLCLVATDSVSLLMTALVPKTNAAVALVLLYETLLIIVGGYLVKPNTLTKFYKASFRASFFVQPTIARLDANVFISLRQQIHAKFRAPGF
ncbi:hypothetical protein XA68_16120 [Ophiocordyceps unilateralis]|uniref:ABC transporter domain-containing protein n=1 Tax=Ophiocordyceps unilateralis TaxID=268505 RepID=A0A2A9P5C7_OPHUN|nr:hypothetical protein XA68_16120 [Ophiocordyceps unilateralis]